MKIKTSVSWDDSIWFGRCVSTFLWKLLPSSSVTYCNDSMKGTQQILSQRQFFFSIFTCFAMNQSIIWDLTRHNNRYNAVTCQTFGIHISFLWDRTLQNYPYNKIVLVSQRKSKAGLRNTILKTLSIYM
jgi:hypothetical protein